MTSCTNIQTDASELALNLCPRLFFARRNVCKAPHPAAVAINHAESQVLHGENGGRRLKHVAVVEELVKVDRLENGKLFSKDFETKVPAGFHAKNPRLVVFVQEADQGAVVGSAMKKIEAAVNEASR